MNIKTITLITFGIFLSLYVSSQEINCERTTSFGSIEFCLPAIPGMTECYLDEKVKVLADATEVPINTVLGYYLSNKDYNKRDLLGEFTIDDFLKVYGTKKIKDTKMNVEKLGKINNSIPSNFRSKSWEEIVSSIDDLDLNIEIGAPTLIENYSHNDRSFTYVLLSKYVVDENNSRPLQGGDKYI